MGKVDGADGTTEYRRSSGRSQAPEDLSRIFNNVHRQEPIDDARVKLPHYGEPIGEVRPLPHYGEPIGETRPLISYEGSGSLDNIRPLSTFSGGVSSEITLAGIDSITNEDLAASGETARNLERLYRSLKSGPPTDRERLSEVRQDLINHLSNDYIPRLEQQLADLEVDLPSGSTIVRAEYNDIAQELDRAKTLLAELNGTDRAEASEGVDDAEVQASADRIEKLLDSKGWNQWVTTGEITEVTNEFENLTPEEANAVFDELESRGLLDDLIREIYDRGPGNNKGLPENVRKEFFDDLASKLDGDNLAAVTNELREASNDFEEGRPQIAEFTDSIVENASDSAKIEYISAIADQIPTESRDHLHPHRNAHAISAAHVIASLADNPAHVQQALDRLSPDQLRTVINEAVNLEVSHPSDPSKALYTPIADAVSQLGDRPEETLLKARFFELSGLELGRDRADLRETLEAGMTKILLSDTNGIIEELAYGDETAVDSDALSEYIEQLIETDKEEVVAEIHAQLLLGNDLSGDHRERFDEEATILGGNDDYHVNAFKLGYFAGSVERAINNIESDDAAKREKVVEILSLGVGIITPVIGGVGGTATSIGAGVLIDQINGRIDDQNLSFDELIVEASIPANQRGGRSGDEQAIDQFEHARIGAREDD